MDLYFIKYRLKGEKQVRWLVATISVEAFYTNQAFSEWLSEQDDGIDKRTVVCFKVSSVDTSADKQVIYSSNMLEDNIEGYN